MAKCVWVLTDELEGENEVLGVYAKVEDALAATKLLDAGDEWAEAIAVMRRGLKEEGKATLVVGEDYYFTIAQFDVL